MCALRLSVCLVFTLSMLGAHLSHKQRRILCIVLVEARSCHFLALCIQWFPPHFLHSRMNELEAAALACFSLHFNCRFAVHSKHIQSWCAFFSVLAACCCSIVGYVVGISFRLSTSRYHNCHLSLSVACVHLALYALNLGYLTGDNTNSDLCVSSEIAKEMNTLSFFLVMHVYPY